jgi:general secretion pathway protein A
MFYCIRERKGAAMLTGEYGAGKTVLTRALLRELLKESAKYKAALIVNPALPAIGFLREIIFQLENKVFGGDKFELIHKLNDILYASISENKDVVIIVDEAQIIRDEEMFEELRLLLNFQMNERFLLTLLLVGQPELRQKIDMIPQLKQRLAIAAHLNGLAKDDVPKYIDYRCTVAGRGGSLFDEAATDMIATCSAGIPRKINTICELSLLEGMLERKGRIDTDIVKKILEDLYL